MFNHSTNMIVARENSTTTITMTADYRGDPKEFAVVIAVPTVLTREQIKTADAKLIDWLDKIGAPRLTEAYDPDPCPSLSAAPTKMFGGSMTRSSAGAGVKGPVPQSAPLGVTVEAQYAVGAVDLPAGKGRLAGTLRTISATFPRAPSFGVPRLRGRESRARKKKPSAAKPP
jgi:hypothetical protein